MRCSKHFDSRLVSKLVEGFVESNHTPRPAMIVALALETLRFAARVEVTEVLIVQVEVRVEVTEGSCPQRRARVEVTEVLLGIVHGLVTITSRCSSALSSLSIRAS